MYALRDEAEAAAFQSSSNAFEQLWGSLRTMLHLNNDQFGNFVNLVTIHSVLDRMLSLLLVLGIGRATRSDSPPPVEKLLSEIADLGFAKRVALAELMQLISAEAAGDLREVNRVRNKVVHWKPAQGFGLDGVEEITSKTAFEQLAARGARTIVEIWKSLEP